MSSRRPASRSAVEVLEIRRLLSRWNLETIIAAGEHHPGCSCGGCSGGNGDAEATLASIQNVEREIRQQPTPERSPAIFYSDNQNRAAADAAGPESAFGAVGAQPTGSLTGKIVYVGAGHGWTVNNTGAGNWYTQRGETFEMIEDMGNQDQMIWYANYLWNAGATVVPLRPIGSQVNEVVVDNGAATFSGSWSNGGSTPWYGTAGDAVRYRASTSATTETAVATYTPNIPQSGFYPVYTWALDGSNRATDQLYRVNHSGGSTEVKINHRWVGKGWVYLGTFHFNAGTSQSVQISNKSSAAGSAIIADAIRLGNGMGEKTNASGQKSNAPREDEASIYWYEFSRGVGVSDFYRGGSASDGDANVGAPSRWAAYMNAAPFGQSVHLSFHSNAGGGRGAVGLYNNETLFPNTATPNQLAWATYVGQQTNQDMQAIGSPPLETAWSTRTSHTFARSDFAFGEIRTSANGDEFDSTILEVAFHDDAGDANLMRDPKVRNAVGRSSYQATVQYFANFGGVSNPVNLPDAPANVQATTNAAGDVTLRWTPPAANSVVGDAATGYRIYSSSNGYGFDGGLAVAGGGTIQHTIPASQLPGGADAIYWRVAATNAGGESPPSPVAVTRRGASTTDKVLVVNGNPRWDRTNNVRQTLPNSLVIDRVRPRANNSFDYVVQAGEAIEAYAAKQLGIDSATSKNVELGQINLSNYNAVIWMSGETSTVDRTFTVGMQAFVADYIDAGGRIFVSGAEVGWDLDAQNNGRAFFNNTLRADYAADDANTYATTGVAGSIFAGISPSFDNGAQTYNVDFPDVLTGFGGSTVALNYSNGAGGAATQYVNALTQARTVVMGFPFETITTEANRNAIMAAVLGFITADTTAPTVSGESFAFEQAQSLQFTFSEDVNASLSASDLIVTNLSTMQVVPGSQYQLSYNPVTRVAGVAFNNVPGGYLADGNYRLTFAPGGVTDLSGNAIAPATGINFFTLAGDATRDRTVNLDDFTALAAAFGSAGALFSQGDFNYDDAVNLGDFTILAANFGQSLPAGGDVPRVTLAAGRPAPAGENPFSQLRVTDDVLEL
ncbi:MAG TPA: hypothetical protein PLD59_02440 [Tepidisphaeraceae bacterium]|nr:hypothetical protein [Tepidisphaeraceae bacterium]